MSEMRRMQAPDVVVLVPGFLGFARFGGFYYFADRVVAVLRGLLEEHTDYPVPVVPCFTLPTHGLADRQGHLLDYLRRLCTDKLSGVERIHLVGHSTGGVDAQLLASTAPIEGRSWGKQDRDIRRKLSSVVTIASPHYGTCLADSRLARLGENPLAHPTGIPSLASTLFDLALLVPRSAAATAGFHVASPNDVLKFLWQIIQSRDLIADLRPTKMEELRSKLRPDPQIPITCFVTGTKPRDDAERPSDPFFRDLYDLTMGCAEVVSLPVEQSARFLQGVLRNQPELVIRSPRSILPESVDATLNDGVVNTARQLLDSNQSSQLGGIVIADHADVIGHYDRGDALIEGRSLNGGLLRSGAGFGDNEFFELYGRVADAIIRTIPRKDAHLVEAERIEDVDESAMPPPPPAG